MLDASTLSLYSSAELVKLYSLVLSEMKKQQIVRSKNITGDLGEFIAIDYYNKTKGLPRLQFAPPSTKNIDAISINGDRYSIKTTTTNTTGAFYGIEKDAALEDIKQGFEFLIVVKLSEDFTPELIIESNWGTFLKHKHWHSRIRAHNIMLTHDFINDSKIIYKKQ